MKGWEMAELEREEKKNMFEFLNIASLFKKENKASEKELQRKEQSEAMLEEERRGEHYRLHEAQKTKERAKQAEIATSFLNAGCYDLYFNMLRNGYEPNSNQNSIITSYCNNLIQQQGLEKALATFDTFIENGFIMPQFLVICICTHHTAPSILTRSLLLGEEEHMVLGLKHFSVQFQEKIHEKGFTNTLFNMWEKQPTCETTLVFGAWLDMAPEFLLANIKLERYLAQVAQVKNRISEQKSVEIICEDVNHANKKSYNKKKLSLKKIFDEVFMLPLKTVYAQSIQDNLEKTKAVYGENYLSRLTLENARKVEYSVDALPREARHLINKIESVFTQVNQEKTLLSDDEKFDLDNLFQKRIPEVMQKYLAISADYRESMVNTQGKNAKDLMLESLGNYAQKLEQMLEHQNERKLSDLSAVSRYSRQIV